LGPTAPLGDQLGGALRDPLDQLLGDVEGKRRHGLLLICVPAIALTVQAETVLHRLHGGLAAKSTISPMLTFSPLWPTLTAWHS